MHEVGITKNLIDIAETHARQAGASQIQSVTVEIGDLSGVIAEAVEFCFEAVSRNTMLEGSRLIIKRIPGEMSCNECQHKFSVTNLTLECPACGGFRLTTLQGKELKITEMEIE